MSFILDLFVIFIFLICLYTGFKKGFIRSVMSIVVVVIAILGSIKLTPVFSGYFNEKFISPIVNDKVEDAMTSLAEDIDSFDISKLFEEKPREFIEFLERFDMSYEEANEFYEEEAETSKEPKKELSEYISDSFSKTVSNVVAFAVLFISFSIILTLIMLVINAVAKLPILNVLNKSLGLILGIVKGLLYAWGLSIIFINLLPHLAVIYEGQISPTVIDDTILVRFFGAINVSSLF